jgi:hypothetical protein
VVSTTLRLDSDVIGARAGLVVLGADYAWIGLVQSRAGIRLVCRRMGSAGDEETLAEPVAVPALPGGGGAVTGVCLRAATGETGLVRFSWSLDDARTWQDVPHDFQAVSGRWIGAEIGLFACAPAAAGGHPRDDHHRAVFGAVEFAVQPVSGESHLLTKA